MKLPILLRPEAEEDIVATREWYSRQREALGNDFLDAVRDVIGRIEAAPDQFATTFGNVRRAKTRKFPYIVYYRLMTDRIEVLGILHGSREPRTWQRRI